MWHLIIAFVVCVAIASAVMWLCFKIPAKKPVTEEGTFETAGQPAETGVAATEPAETTETTEPADPAAPQL